MTPRELAIEAWKAGRYVWFSTLWQIMANAGRPLHEVLAFAQREHPAEMIETRA